MIDNKELSAQTENAIRTSVSNAGATAESAVAREAIATVTPLAKGAKDKIKARVKKSVFKKQLDKGYSGLKNDKISLKKSQFLQRKKSGIKDSKSAISKSASKGKTVKHVKAAPRALIKKVSKAAMIKQLINEEHPAETLSLVGKQGINAIVHLMVRAARLMLRVAAKGLLKICILFSPVFLLFSGVFIVFLLIGGGTAGTVAYERYVKEIKDKSSKPLDSPRVEVTVLDYDSDAYAYYSNTFTGSVALPNCTAWVYYRRCELLKAESITSLKDAETYWLYNNYNKVYESGMVPKPGSIAVWAKNSDESYVTDQKDKWGNYIVKTSGDAGHVAIVEKIDDDGTIYLSESGYGKENWNPYRVAIVRGGSESMQKRWNSLGYTFLGYIYLEKVEN